MISLASIDVYGNPYDVPCVYDVLSEREMKHHQVDFMNAKQLLSDHIKNTKIMKESSSYGSSASGDDNMRFVYETIRRRATGEIRLQDEKKIFFNHGIDISNAIEYYNSQYLKGSPSQNNFDVYKMMIDHVRRNPGCDYFIDELPILINRKCKFSNLFDIYSILLVINHSYVQIKE